MRTPSAPVPTAFLEAPADNPLLPGVHALLPGVHAAALTAPATWLLLDEDDRIGKPRHPLLEGNFAAVSGPTHFVRFPEAGYSSRSDIAGLVEATMSPHWPGPPPSPHL